MKKLILFLIIFAMVSTIFAFSMGYNFPERPNFSYVNKIPKDLNPMHEKISSKAWEFYCKNKKFDMLHLSMFLDLPKHDENDVSLKDQIEQIDCHVFNDISTNYADYLNSEGLFPGNPIRTILLGSRYPDLFEKKGILSMNPKKGDNKIPDVVLNEIKDEVDEIDLSVDALYPFYHAQLFGDGSAYLQNANLGYRVYKDFIIHMIYEMQALALYRTGEQNEGENFILAYYSVCQEIPNFCTESEYGINVLTFLANVATFNGLGVIPALLEMNVVNSNFSTEGSILYRAPWFRVSLGVLFHSFQDSFAHSLRFLDCDDDGKCHLKIAAMINTKLNEYWKYNHDFGIVSTSEDATKKLMKIVLSKYFSEDTEKIDNAFPEIPEDVKPEQFVKLAKDSIKEEVDNFNLEKFTSIIQNYIPGNYFNPFESRGEKESAEPSGAFPEFEKKFFSESGFINLNDIPDYFFWKGGKNPWEKTTKKWLKGEYSYILATYATVELLDLIRFVIEFPGETNEIQKKINAFFDKWLQFDIQEMGGFDISQYSKSNDYDTYPWFNYHLIDVYKIHGYPDDVKALYLPWDKNSEHPYKHFVIKVEDPTVQQDQPWYERETHTYHALKGVLSIFKTWQDNDMNTYYIKDFVKNVSLEENGKYKKRTEDPETKKISYELTKFTLDPKEGRYAFAFIPPGYVMCLNYVVKHSNSSKHLDRCFYGGKDGRTAYFSDFMIPKGTPIVVFPVDADNDGIIYLKDLQDKKFDNCPFAYNPDQKDTYTAIHVDGNPRAFKYGSDGIGDACQDSDNDGVLDINDKCPGGDDTIKTSDGKIRDCSKFPQDSGPDNDKDGVPDMVDNCKEVYNPFKVAPFSEIIWASINSELFSECQNCTKTGALFDGNLLQKLYMKIRNRFSGKTQYIHMTGSDIYQYFLNYESVGNLSDNFIYAECKSKKEVSQEEFKKCISDNLTRAIKNGSLQILWQPDNDLDGIGDACDNDFFKSEITNVTKEDKVVGECNNIEEGTILYRHCTHKQGEYVKIKTKAKGPLLGKNQNKLILNEVRFCGMNEKGDFENWGKRGYCTTAQKDFYERQSDYDNKKPLVNFGYSHGSDLVVYDQKKKQPIWKPMTIAYSKEEIEEQYQKMLAKLEQQNQTQTRLNILPEFHFSNFLNNGEILIHPNNWDSEFLWNWKVDFCKYYIENSYEKCLKLSKIRTVKNAEKENLVLHYALSSGVESDKNAKYLKEDGRDANGTIRYKVNPEHFYNKENTYARSSRFNLEPLEVSYSIYSTKKLIGIRKNDEYVSKLPRQPILGEFLPEAVKNNILETVSFKNNNKAELVQKYIMPKTLTIVLDKNGYFYAIKNNALYRGTGAKTNDWIKLGDIENMPEMTSFSATVMNHKLYFAGEQNSSTSLFSIDLTQENYTAKKENEFQNLTDLKLVSNNQTLFIAGNDENGLVVLKQKENSKEISTLVSSDFFKFGYSLFATQNKLFLAGGYNEDNEKQTELLQISTKAKETTNWELLTDNLPTDLQNITMNLQNNNLILIDPTNREFGKTQKYKLDLTTLDFDVQPIKIEKIDMNFQTDQCVANKDNLISLGISLGERCLVVSKGKNGFFETAEKIYSIAGKSNTLYVAMENQIKVFNIDSNGTLSEKESVSVVGTPFDMVVVNQHLYVGTQKGIVVFSIKESGQLSFKTEVATSGRTKSIKFFADKLYVGDRIGIKVFNLENPDLPQLEQFMFTAGDVETLEVDNDFIFVSDWLGIHKFDRKTLFPLKITFDYCPNPLLKTEDNILYLACDNSVFKLNENWFWFDRQPLEGERSDLSNSYIFNNIVYTSNEDGIFISTPMKL